jgi:hypothetical protein
MRNHSAANESEAAMGVSAEEARRLIAANEGVDGGRLSAAEELVLLAIIEESYEGDGEYSDEAGFDAADDAAYWNASDYERVS